MEQLSADRRLITVNIDRRWYGRRYTWLPVDSLSHEGFEINCEESYMKPAQYDLQPGDIVRWQEEGRTLETEIVSVERTAVQVKVGFGEVELLPVDFFIS
jgi:hypothetical protein